MALRLPRAQIQVTCSSTAAQAIHGLSWLLRGCVPRRRKHLFLGGCFGFFLTYGATEDKTIRWHHRLNGHEFEQPPEDSEGQGSLVCCGPWGHKESDMT